MLSSKLDLRRVRRGKGHPCFAIVIRLILQTAASIAPNLIVAAGNVGQCISLLIGAIKCNFFRATYLIPPRKATRAPPLRVDKFFEKVRPPTHGSKFPRSPWFF